MKLNQVVHVLDKDVKPNTSRQFADIHRRSSTIGLFNGQSRVYEPLKDDDPEKLPPDNQRVQYDARDSASKAKTLLADYYNLVAQRDIANTVAKADVEVDGVVLVKDAPVPFLLFLDKQLKHEIKPFIDALPTLAQEHEWSSDQATGLWKSQEVRTHKTKKVPTVITLAPATDKHPAQTQLRDEDKLVGYWKTTLLSGALQAPTKEAMLERVDKLLKAVKIAIQDANGINATKTDAGDKLLAFIFDPVKK